MLVKMAAMFLLAVSLTACNTLQGNQPPPASPVPTATIGPAANMTPPGPQVSVITPTPQMTLTNQDLTPVMAELFGALTQSVQVISPNCGPKTVRFEVSPANQDIYSVVFFYRLRYKISNDRTSWNLGIPMTRLEGKFVYELSAGNIEGFNQFKEPVAWVQYQLAATDASGKILGRSSVFADQLTISTICP